MIPWYRLGLNTCKACTYFHFNNMHVKLTHISQYYTIYNYHLINMHESIHISWCTIANCLLHTSSHPIWRHTNLMLAKWLCWRFDVWPCAFINIHDKYRNSIGVNFVIPWHWSTHQSYNQSINLILFFISVSGKRK